MRSLSLEERGFYDAALDLIYEEEGPITEVALKHETGVRDRRTWTRVMTSLIGKGKLTLTLDGRITNERAMFEIAQMQADSEERRAAGSRGGRKRALRELKKARQSDLFGGETGNSSATRDEKPSEIKEPPQAQPLYARTRARGDGEIDEELATSRRRDGDKMGNLSGNSPENANKINGTAQATLKHIDSDIREETPPLVPPSENEPSRKKSRRAQPLPPDWEPPPLTERIATIVGTWPDDAFEVEVEKFTNYALAQGRTCKDWDAAFRNWIIQADEYRQRRTPHHERPSGWIAANRVS